MSNVKKEELKTRSAASESTEVTIGSKSNTSKHSLERTPGAEIGKDEESLVNIIEMHFCRIKQRSSEIV